MALTPTAIAIAAGEELQNIFGDAIDTVRQGEANYLRDGEPQSISGGVSQAAGRSACRIYGQGTVDLNARAAERYERACRPYLDSIAPGGEAGLKVPFRGGQCPISYQVNIGGTWSRAGCGESTGQPPEEPGLPTLGPIVGPITALQKVRILPGNCGPRVIQVQATNQGGTTITADVAVVAPSQFIFSDNITLALVPLGGATDDCGSPPPVVIPPDPIPDPNPPPFPFNPSPDVDIDLDVDIDVDGRITINIGTGPITVDPFGDGDGDGDGGDGDGGGGGTRPPGDIGEPSAPVDTGPAGESDGEAPAGKVLVALKIGILEYPRSRYNYTQDVFRGVCYVYMGTSDGLDHDPAGAMLRDNQLVFAEKDNLTSWKVAANLGYNLRVTPYYGDPIS